MSAIIIFIVFSVAGWFFELLYFHKMACDSLFRMIGICPPILTIYGLGGLILYAIHQMNIPLLPSVIISTILITAIECAIGLISYKYNGYHTWEYKKYSACKGYISLGTSFVWGILSMLLLYVMTIIK